MYKVVETDMLQEHNKIMSSLGITSSYVLSIK